MPGYQSDKKKGKKKKEMDETPPEKYVPENAEQSAFTGPSFTEGLVTPQYGGGDFGAALNALSQQSGGGADNAAMWQYLKSLPPQETPSEYARTKAQLANPEKYARDQYMAKTYAAPFAEGGLFSGRGAASMDPSVVAASQGNNAMNQWAQARAGGVSPGQLSRNANAAAENYRNAPSPAAKQDYAKALEAKAVAAREMQGAPSNKNTRAQQSTGAMLATQAFGNAPYMNPDLQWGNQEQVNKVAQAFDPNKFTPEEMAEFERLASATTPKTYM